MKNFIYFSLLVSITAFSCLEIKEPYSAMAPGMYQGKLLLSEDPYEYYDEDATREKRVPQFPDISDSEIPFNFIVEYTAEDSLKFTFINGKEKIEVEDVSFGTERSTAHDTVRIRFPEYNSYLYAEFSEDRMQGRYGRTDKENYTIPFVAKYGIKKRFPRLKNEKEPEDFSGNWDVTFTKENGEKVKAIGQFKQNDNQLEGTFATSTGDYRFLEGVVEEDKMWLSAFDGSHAFLFGAKMISNDSIQGYFKSGLFYTRTWTAVRSDKANLKDPMLMSQRREKSDSFFIEFPWNKEGKFSLNSGEFKGKPKIIEIMGTWCPNCKDAGNFLNEYIDENPDSPVKIAGIAYERGKTQEEMLSGLKSYSERYNYNFPLVLGGPLNENTRNSNPWIKDIKSYPTLIFFNHENEIQQIYTGFYGPATEEYSEFKKTFQSNIQELIKAYESAE